jgi:uncharacterized protein (DUF362 family)
MSKGLDRRQFIVGAAASATALAAGTRGLAQSSPSQRGLAPAGSLAATPPAGFTPMSAPGRVVKVTRPNSLRPGGLFPTQEAATTLVDRAVRELTGESDLGAAWRHFVHPSDRVGIKVNGLGLRNMASNKETVVAIINGLMAAGVPASQIVVYDQWQGFLGATRLTRRDVPQGVRLLTHNNAILGRETRVASGRTQYAQALLDCTAIVGVPLVKDHSLSGFTGAMKNMTHGSIRNPEDFHRHQCSPQIAELYAHEAIRSRVRLHVMDAFKVLYDRGPQDNPAARVPYNAVMVSTDPVALDRIGAEIVNQFRAQNRMQSLERRGTPPRYIDHGAQLGLGIADRARIDLREISLT